MIKLYPSKDTSSTVTAGKASSYTLGVFYNSWDKLYHVCEYIPYKCPPGNSLCGIFKHQWPGTGGPVEYVKERLCSACAAKLKETK